MKVKDLRGQRFGKLTVLRPVQAWVCRCDCGQFKRILGAYLKPGENLSCGRCSSKDRADARRTHGLSNTGAYKAWVQMRNRCYNPKFVLYERYGGRGITVCDRWKNSFPNFYADMGERPIRYSLDRIDNDGNYEPENCRWTDSTTQQRNKSSNRVLEYFGIRKSGEEWIESLGTTRKVFWNRINKCGVEEGILQIIFLKMAGITPTPGTKFIINKAA